MESTVKSERMRQATESIQQSAESIKKTVKGTIDQISETEIAKMSKETLSKTAEKIGETAEAVGETVSKVSEPIRKSRVYTSVKEQVIDLVEDDTGRYVGYQEKEYRRKRNEELKTGQKHRVWNVTADPTYFGFVMS